jgi:hypothetical protein
MSSRWITRSLILCAVTTLAVPAVGIAQTSRVRGLAVQGDYIKDYTGIFTYVSGVSNVGNLIYGELGDLAPTAPAPAFTSPTDKSVGAVLGNLWDGRLGTWAIHMRQLTPALGQGDTTSSPGPGNLGGDPNTNRNESFDLMWGKKFGTTSLGLRLNRSYMEGAGDAAVFAGATTLKFDFGLPVTPGSSSAAYANVHRNVMGLSAGVGFEMNPNTSAEFALLWQNRTYERVTATTREENDGAATYMLAGRAMWQWQPNVLVVPVLKYYSYDLSTSAPAPVGALDNTLKGWQLGAAGNWTLGQNDLFVLGLTFAQNTVDQQTSVVALPAPLAAFNVDDGTITETLAPQIFAALETHVNTWLTLRFGATKGAYTRIKTEDRSVAPVVSNKLTYSPFTMAIGAGVKLGTLQLDAVLNDSFPQTLGGFFSNTSEYVAFNRVTATYSF